MTLMALSNADRCSDLAALDRDFIRWTPTGVQFTVVHLTKTQRAGPPRTVVYSALQDDPNICPVSNLRRYIEMTTPHVNNMKTSNQYSSLLESLSGGLVQPLWDIG